MHRRVLSHLRGHAVAYIALFLALSGVAYAAIPSSDGTIKGCYARMGGLVGGVHSKGDLRVVDQGEACRSYENALILNQGTAQQVLDKLRTVDGSGSGLDADRIDGLDSTSFLQSGATAGGDLTGTYPNPTLANGAIDSVGLYAADAIPAGRVALSADTPFTDFTAGIVDWDAEAFDIGDLHTSADPSALVARVAGIYEASANVGVVGPYDGFLDLTMTRTFSDTSFVVASERVDHALEGVAPIGSATGLVSLAAGQGVSLQVFVNGPNAVLDAAQTSLSLHWVAPPAAAP